MRKTNPFQKGTMQTYIFHIPHTSTVIPDHTNFVVDKVKTELDLLTDHAVDEIFDIDGITKIINESVGKLNEVMKALFYR